MVLIGCTISDKNYKTNVKLFLRFIKKLMIAMKVCSLPNFGWKPNLYTAIERCPLLITLV